MSLPTWVHPDETKPAPMPLLVVQAFVNTYEAEEGTDELAQPESARRWLVDAGLISASDAIGPDEAELARAAREGLRAMLEANAAQEGPGSQPLQMLQQFVGSVSTRLTLEADGTVELDIDAGDPVAGALAQLLLIVRDAQRDGTWARLKACSNDQCRWAYYDRSHSSRGRWCDMAVCGNRMKNRALRARRQQPS